MSAITGWNQERAAEIIAAEASREGAALPILHGIQAAFGFVPEAVIPMIAEALNLTRAEVHGIVSFYHDFRAAPAGRNVLKLCRAEACQAMGGDTLAAHTHDALRACWGETSADGAVTVEAVYCLGLCACAPAALWNGRPVGRLTNAHVDTLLAGAK